MSHPGDSDARRASRVCQQLDRVEARVLASPGGPAALVNGQSANPAEVAAILAAAPLHGLRDIDRCTRRLRYPERALWLSDEVKRGILAMQPPLLGPVVAVIINLKSVVVGPFDSPEDALAWWDAPWNRMAESCHFAIVEAPRPTTGCRRSLP